MGERDRVPEHPLLRHQHAPALQAVSEMDSASCIDKDDNPDLREFGFYDPSCIKTTEDWHGNVHQHYVRSVLFDRLDGSVSILCLGNHMIIRVFHKHVADRLPVLRVIVCDNNSYKSASAYPQNEKVHSDWRVRICPCLLRLGICPPGMRYEGSRGQGDGSDKFDGRLPRKIIAGGWQLGW
jgi:hypothetical protein